uniref:Phosphoserine aminotransferase putative n=1 Tax=Albugo laibachii Nc14 TaxID=890382 RepID=F0WF34_9STRA|nr:phosphoserine aminotransferase putative [Albugo laibachii Nc14]|eukprot:CCA19816.1 phosphoserine aminotransferase putative [Albugo laibachii Nc14]
MSKPLSDADSFSTSMPARKRARQEADGSYTGSQAPGIPFYQLNSSRIEAVTEFIASYREHNSRPFQAHASSSVYPNAITVSSMLHALCNQFQVFSFQELMQKPSADPMKLPGLREIQSINERLWTFCTVFQQSRGIHTLYECYQAFLVQEQIEDFCDLGVGNSFRLTEAVQACYGRPQDSSFEALMLLPLKTYDVLRHLRAFDQQLQSESRVPFSETRSSARIHREDFLGYLTHRLSSELRSTHSPTQLGVFISPSSFGQYIGLLRRISFQERKELKALEMEFQKGIAERVFEITKEKFSSANRENAIAECLKQQEKRWKSELQENSAGSGRKASNTNSSCLSLDILRRVTSIDVYLDRELQRKLQAQSASSKSSWSISSHAIAEQDARIRKRLKTCLTWTQKSCQYSRIKVVTWVVCGIIAKIHALLMDKDKALASKFESSPQQSHKAERSEDESELEECACCCVGKDSCGCSCTCACHQDSSEEEGSCEPTSEHNAGQERLQEAITKFLHHYMLDKSVDHDMESTSRSQWTLEMLCALEEHLKMNVSASLGSSSWLCLVKALGREKPLLKSIESPSPGDYAPVNQTSVMEVFWGLNDREISRFLHQYITNHALESNWNDRLEHIAARVKEHFGPQHFEDEESLHAFVASKVETLLASTPPESEELIVYASALAIEVPSKRLEPETVCERIYAQLEACPFLSSVERYLHWEANYQRQFGAFSAFLSSFLMSFIATKRIGSQQDFVLVVEFSGKVWKLQHPDSLQLESLAKVSDENDSKSLGRLLASRMASLVLKYRGISHLPNALTTFYLREFFQRVPISNLDLVLAGFCTAMAFSFAAKCIPLVLEAVQSIGNADFATQTKIKERIWSRIDLETDQNSLRWLACLLDIPSWQMPIEQKSVEVKPEAPQTPCVDSFEPVDDVMSPKHPPSPIFHAPTKEACRALIESIRTSRLGLEIPQAPADTNGSLVTSTRQIFTSQQRRLGRALKRLSAELYAFNSHFVLELIQNADDAVFQGNVSPTCKLLITENSVEFTSNEVGFTDANVQALCDVGASTKESDATCIGNKGIGFKSVFKISDRPQVHSNGFHIQFQASSSSDNGMLGYIVPTWIEDPALWRVDCGTSIVLPFHEEARRWKEAIVEALHATIEPSLLLFLRRIKQLQVDHNAQQTCIAKQENWARIYCNDIKWKHISLSESSKGHNVSWLLVEKTIAVPERITRQSSSADTRLVVGLPLGTIDPPYQKVFAFLPVRSYGFRFIVQGDFILPSSRESIDASSEWNQWLLTFLPDLFEHIATHLWLPGSPNNPDWISREQFHRLLPVEKHVEAPFRCIVREILQRLAKAPWIPSTQDTLLPPCTLLEVPVDVLEQDEWVESLMLDATHKRALSRETSSTLSKEIKCALQIESLQAIHVVRMLAVFTQAIGRSEEEMAKNEHKLVVLFNLLSKLWPIVDRGASHALSRELEWIPCFPVDRPGERHISLKSAENGLFLPWKVKPATHLTHNPIVALVQSLKYTPVKPLAVVDGAFLLQLDGHTIEFLTRTIGLEPLDAHKVLEYQVLPGLKAHALAEMDHLQLEKWLFCLLDHLDECDVPSMCPVRTSGLLPLPVITEGTSRQWLDSERQHPFMLLTLWPIESEKEALTETPEDIVRAADAQHVRFLCPEFLYEMERRNTRDRYLSKRRILNDICNVQCLWDLESSAALDALDTILHNLVQAGASRGLKTFAMCLQRFSQSPASSFRHAHKFFRSLRELEWVQARDEELYRPMELWLTGKDPLIDDVNGLAPVPQVDWRASKWIESLGFQQAISLENVLSIIRNISRVRGDNYADSLGASSTALYRFLAKNCSNASKASGIWAVFQAEAVYCIKDESSFIVSSKSDVVWSTSSLTPSWHFPLDSMYPASLKAFFTEFCGVSETPSIVDVCQHLTSSKTTSSPEALMSLAKHWSGLINEYAVSSTELQAIQNALSSSQSIWLPTATRECIGIPANDRVVVIPCDEDEARIRKALKQLCPSPKVFSSLEFDVVDLETDEVAEILALLTQTPKVVRMNEHVRVHRYQWAKLLSRLGDLQQTENSQSLLRELLSVWAAHKDESCPKYRQWRDLMQHEVLYPCCIPGSARRFQHLADQIFVNDTNELSEEDLATLEVPVFSLDKAECIQAEVSSFLTDICGIQSLRSNLVTRVCPQATEAVNDPATEEGLRVDVLCSLEIYQRLLLAHYPELYRTLEDLVIVQFANAFRCSITLADTLQVRYELGHRAVTKSVKSALDRISWTLHVARGSSLDYLDIMRTCCKEWLPASGNMNVMSIANVLYLAWMQPHAAREAFLQTTQRVPPLELIQPPWQESRQVGRRHKSRSPTRTSHVEKECSQTLPMSFTLFPDSVDKRLALGDGFGVNFSAMTQEERYATGRFGEEYVYHKLVEELESSGSSVRVIWVNKERESGLPYDLKLVSTTSGQPVHYIEVKSTRMMEKASFEITMNEVEHASVHGSDYSIYRVFQAKKWHENASCRVVRIRDPIAQIRLKRMQLMAVMCASDELGA